MLSDQELKSILAVELPPLEIRDIHWKIQDSDKYSIVFYKLGPDPISRKLFRERVQNAQFAWLIVNSDDDSRPINSSVIEESKWPLIQKQVLDALYPLPALKLLAVTGTNGKTTTADLVLQLGELHGQRGLSIGTLGVRSGGQTLVDFGMTSPPFIDLRKYLHRFGDQKDFCVLEASSHALAQERLFGLEFENAGWLSFSQDHLDYHQTMEEYFAAKLLLLKHIKAGGKLILPTSEKDLFQRISRVSDQLILAPELTQKLPLFFSTSFNRNNLEVAVSLVEMSLGIKVSPVFDKIQPPDGRFYIRAYNDSFIVVDFAHTPDALDNICRGIRSAFPEYRLKILFGCGGDRDRSKRPLMGKIAETWADEIYVTSDNPRSEDPAQIIEDIVQGMGQALVHRIIDRPEAVATAFSALGGKEVLLLAGKGHEDYILKNGVKLPYSDIEEVEKFLSRKNL